MIHRFIAGDRLIAAPLFIRLILPLFRFYSQISIPRLNDPREKKKKKRARCVERAAKGCRLARGGGGGKEGNAADDAVRVSEWISDRVNDQTSSPLPSFVYVHWVVNIFGWSPSGD